MEKTKFHKKDVLESYGHLKLGREIYNPIIDFKLPIDFKRNPRGFLEEKIKTGEIKRTVYEGDRSTILEWRKGNRNLYIKRMEPAKNIDLMHDITRKDKEKMVEERGLNEIYSSSNVHNLRLIRTSSEVILSGLNLHESPNFYIVMRQYPPGSFLDDFLKTKGHVNLSSEEMKRIVIEPLSETMIKMHGTMDEKGILQRDFHPGNVYLMRPEKNNPFGIMILDWELVDRHLKPSKLNWESRMKELERFVNYKDNLKPPWKETFDQKEFDTFIEEYEKRLE